MIRNKTLFISDIHLRGLQDARERHFIHFLEMQAPSLLRLVIVGDLFDFWVGHKTVIYHAYWPILHVLMELREQGVEIHYLEGNHDFHLGTFFKETLGCHIYTDEAHINFDGVRISLYHGDKANKKELRYRCIRAFLRSWFVRLALKCVHPDVIWKIGHKASSLSHRYHPKKENERRAVMALYRDFAETKLKTTGSDVVLVGHSHYPDEAVFKFHNKEATYYNLGDWVTHFSYLEFENSHFQLKFLPFTYL